MTDWRKYDEQFVWHPYETVSSGEKNIPIESAKGIYLHTTDGRKIIDAISSWWVNLHGHSNEYIADAISKQARKLEHVIFAGFTHEPASTYAKRLLEILPSSIEHVFYSDNGSTAVEVGLKMALQYFYNSGEERQKVIALRGAFHGDTFGAMAVGERGIFSKPFHSHLFEVEFIDFPDSENEDKALQQLKNAVAKEEAAAFIFEPLIQGAAGMRTYRAEVLEEMISIARAKGTLCIADEVFTGFGRTGKLFACDHLKIQPDIYCLSKGITGGSMPFGVTACTNSIRKAFHEGDLNKIFFHGHSFTANPLACAAALASLDLLLSDDTQKNITRISAQQAAFSAEIADHPKVARSQHLGTIFSMELKQESSAGYSSEVKDRLYRFFLERNILLRPLGNVLYIVPPYITKEEELNKVHDSIRELLRIS